MCETTLLLEQHPKLMAELVQVVRSCKSVLADSRALCREAVELRGLIARDQEEAEHGPAVRYG